MKDYTLPLFDENRYRPGVGMMIVNSRSQILCGYKRIDVPNAASKHIWQLPQGGIEHRETPEEAMQRKCTEELGVENGIEILNKIPKCLYYTIPPLYLPNSFVLHNWVGHKHVWFLLRLPRENSCININTLRPEFVDWRWSTIDEAVSSAVSYKKELYKSVWAHFGHVAT